MTLCIFLDDDLYLLDSGLCRFSLWIMLQRLRARSLKLEHEESLKPRSEPGLPFELHNSAETFLDVRRRGWSGKFLPPPPPAEKTTASHHQTRQSSTDDGAGNGRRRVEGTSNDVINVVDVCCGTNNIKTAVAGRAEDRRQIGRVGRSRKQIGSHL